MSVKIFNETLEKHLDFLPGKLPSRIFALAKEKLQKHVDILEDQGIFDVLHGPRDVQDGRHDKSPLKSQL
eukprot:6826261-Prymnesium_polylepis.1